MKILLISAYEMGRQPFGLASPAAQLSAAGHEVECLDLSLQPLDAAAVASAELIGFYLPMHTATRIALAALDKVREINADAGLCAFGLYAPVSAEILAERDVPTVIGGEFEPALVEFAARLARPSASAADAAPDASKTAGGAPVKPRIVLDAQAFAVPRRDLLPPLSEYAGLIATDGELRTVGYTEASRGCKHLCRHCPVVPVYEGRFRIVPPDIVLADIDQQVAAGAQHITFGDPDFFNGPRHAEAIVAGLRRNHPELTYDVTIKVEHLLAHANLLPVLRDTGCAFVTSAIESVDDDVLARLDKGHTAADFELAVQRCDAAGVALQPTFVAFNPWISLAGYRDLLATIARLGLIGNVPSVQLAIRLLIPAGSRLLQLDEVRDLVGPFDAAGLGYPWTHGDPRVDALQRRIARYVESAGENADRHAVFTEAWRLTEAALGTGAPLPPPAEPRPARATIPYLTEPWYC